MQPLTLCAYEVDAEPVFDAQDAAQRAEHNVADLALHCPTWEREMREGLIQKCRRSGRMSPGRNPFYGVDWMPDHALRQAQDRSGMTRAYWHGDN